MILPFQFIQRDGTTGSIAYDGVQARVLQNGYAVTGWTSGGVISGIPQGDGYSLQIRQSDGSIDTRRFAVGIIVAALGQSNMEKWFYGNNAAPVGPSTYALTTAGTWGTVNGAAARIFTAELAAQTGAPVAVINSAVGGTSLLPYADKGNGNWTSRDPGSLYENALAQIDSVGGRAEFVLWSQGETDATSKLVTEDAYQQALTSLFSSVASDYGDPKILISEIGYNIYPSFNPYYDAIRAAQNAVAQTVPNVQMGDTTRDLEIYQTVHFTGPSDVAIADRMATSVLADLGIDNARPVQTGTDGNDVLQSQSATGDVLYGLGGNDVLTGGAGSDVIYGGDGNDTITGGQGTGILFGGAGDDTIYGGPSYNAIEGGTGNDTLYGGDGGNDLWGYDGNDIIIGGASADVLVGGKGINILEGRGGADVLDGTEGIDTASYASSPAAVSVSLGTGLATGGDAQGDTLIKIENLTGSAFADTLQGDANNNVLAGLGGADTLDGGAGNDTADYSASAAAVNVSLADGTATGGDAEGDVLISIENLTGSAYDDILIGDSGDNVLAGLGGADTLIGGGGNDTASYAASAAGVNVSLATGTGSGGDAQGDTLSGISNLTGSAFDDVLEGDAGNNLLVGGGGADTASYANATAGVTVSLALAGPQDTIGAGVDTLSGFESLSGSAFADTLTGDRFANSLTGNGGNDFLDGGKGADTMIGGLGDDTYVVDNLGDMVVELLNEGTDTVYSSVRYTLPDNVENLILTGTAAISATGNALNNIISGNSANNGLAGGAGIDTVSYANATAGVTVTLAKAGAQDTIGAGVDRLSGFENLTGSAFDDVLTGTNGANAITGGAGNDTLIGGRGADTLTGGTGADTFVFTASSDSTFNAPGRDTITDFSASDGDALNYTYLASATLRFQEDASGLFGILTVKGNGTTSAVQLAGVFATTDFQMSADGNGGLLITATPH